MSSGGMGLRSGRVLGIAPPPPPPPPPPPIPPGPLPPGIPAPNTFLGLPQALRMAILEAVFSGQPTDQLEGLVQPYTLRCLRRMNRMLRFEALKAYLRVTPFRVTIVSAYPDFDWYHRSINYGQPAPAGAPAPVYTHTLAAFRQMVRRAQILVPSRRSVSWGAQGRIRIARTAGEFPWTSCPQWLQNAGPWIRNIQFQIIYPMPGFPPLTSIYRLRRLEWTYPVSAALFLRVTRPGAVIASNHLFPGGPFGAPAGIGIHLGVNDPTQPIDTNPFDAQCQRAVAEANRVRQTYLPAVLPPGAPGFTGFSLRDLRTIAKAFSEPSIYVIQG